MQRKKHQPNERLRRARELRGWGQKDVAEKLGLLEDRAIRRWETGDSLPSPYYRQRLCTMFEMNALELGFIDAEPSPVALPPREAPQRTTSSHEIVRDKNRQRLLKKVEAFWIEGVLDQSLHHAVLLSLGLEERPEALANPWHLALQQPDVPARPLPTDTSLEAVYDQAHGEVLILGEPGSGKTTLLLTLARCLLERATWDETHALPVVFHLSSWAMKRPPLALWLVEELHDKYQVPRTLGQTWVETGQVIPLLDGLDEVAPAFSTECIEAINAYIPDHPMPLVVCSRKVDYFAQPARLNLSTAVLVQSLTQKQIERYFGQLGERLAPLQDMIERDPVLQELMQTPLMLSILILAYQGQSVDELFTTTASLAHQQRQLFTVYVERMLQRRRPTTRYTPQQTRQWLIALAQQLQTHSQTVFYLENMQPDWLPTRHSRWWYRGLTLLIIGLGIGILSGLLLGVLGSQSYVGTQHQVLYGVGIGLFFGVTVGLGCIVGGGFVSELETKKKAGAESSSSWKQWGQKVTLPPLVGFIVGWSIGLGGGLGIWLSGVPGVGLGPWVSVGLSIGLGSGLGIWLSIGWVGRLTDLLASRWPDGVSPRLHLAESKQESWHSARKRIFFGLRAGMVVGLAGALSILFGGLGTGIGGVLVEVIAFGVPAGLGIGIGGWVFLGKNIHIKPAEVLVWSGERLRQRFTVLLLVGIVAMVLVDLGDLLARAPVSVPPSDWFLGLGAGFGVVVIGLLLAGWSGELLVERFRTKPNQGIWRSARNGALVGLSAGLAVWGSTGMFFGLVDVLVTGMRFEQEALVSGLTFGLVFGLLAGLIAGLSSGGVAGIQHGILRVLLWRNQVIPWHYVQFLDYAAERILLRKVGGGYIFVHRLLQDYFTQLDTPGRLPKNPSTSR